MALSFYATSLLGNFLRPWPRSFTLVSLGRDNDVRAQRYSMASNSVKQTRQQDLTDALRRGSRQRLYHVFDFHQGLCEAQSQRVQPMFHRSLDHEPANHQVQQDVAANFVINRPWSPSPQALQFLADLESRKLVSISQRRW